MLTKKCSHVKINVFMATVGVYNFLLTQSVVPSAYVCCEWTCMAPLLVGCMAGSLCPDLGACYEQITTLLFMNLATKLAGCQNIQ